MSYYSPNKKKILEIISSLTSQKPYTDLNELQNAVPEKWKRKGCGTGNLCNVIVELYRDGSISSHSGNRDDFMEGRQVINKSFFLTPEGRKKISLLRFWPGVASSLIVIATILTAIFTALEYFSE